MSILFARRSINRLSLHPSSIFKYYTSFQNPYYLSNEDNKTSSQTVCGNADKSTNHPQNVKLPTMFPSTKNHLQDVSIELVDPDIWPQTRPFERKINSTESKSTIINDDNKVCNANSQYDGFMDFEEVDDLRLRKELFFKLDKDSKEFEEYNINFHQKKSSKKKLKKQTKQEMKLECKKLEKQVKQVKHEKQETKYTTPSEEHGKKRVRVETFNQLTAPYHMPFCLDIFITKGSVRASIIHRVTSRVVAVAHSISKDLKFDLKSRKDVKACGAVGSVLARRAIEDDIHNVVYTPRKGDRIEGKLEVVLKAIIDCGVDVKVKLKQRKPIKKAQMESSSNVNIFQSKSEER